MVRLPGRLAFLTYERIWFWDGIPFHTQSDILRYLRLTSSQEIGRASCRERV